MSKNNKRNNYNSKSKSRDPKMDSRSRSRTSQGSDEAISSQSKRYINDFSWYSMGQPIDKDVYDYSINGFAGVQLNLSNGSTDSIGGFTSPVTELASIMRVAINPSPGYIGSNPMDAPINRNGYTLFTQLSSVNAKTTQYAPQDITMAILAVGELLSMYSYIVRSLSLPYVYNFRNRSYPISATAASGLDYQDLKSNLANYRVRFNLLCTLADGIMFPDQFDYFKKCKLMFSHITMDGDTATAQTYITVPASTWVLDESSAATGTKLRTVELIKSGKLYKLSEILDVFEQQILALLNSSTLNYVYSDINNYATRYGMSLFKLDPVAENVPIPIYTMQEGKVFLNQIMNATIMGRPNAGTQDVTSEPNSNAILYRPTFTAESPTWNLNKLVNFYEYPEFSDKADYSCFIAAGYSDLGQNTLTTTEVILPDHYVTDISIFGSTKSAMHLNITGNYVNVSDLNQVKYLAEISNFDYAPILITTFHNQEASGYDITGVLGDVGYYTTLTRQQIELINYTAMTSLFKWKK